MPRENLLHVYSQSELHDPVVIIGDRTALDHLKEGIDRTLKGLDGTFLSRVVDGEGFSTLLILVADGDLFPLRDSPSIFEGCERPTRTNVLHVYGQESWHDDVIVVGDRESLRQLTDAVENALRVREASFSTVASADNEFEVSVTLADDELLRTLPLPYFAEFAGGCGGRSQQVARLLRREI